MNRKVVNVDYGVASAYSNGIIEINRKIKGKLRHDIIFHELSHSLGDKYTKKDFRVDFHSENPYFFKTLWFCIRNPEGFINFFPIMYSYYQKSWSYNLSLLFPLSLYALIFALLVTLTFKVFLWLPLLFYLYIITLLNLFFLAYCHLYVKLRHFRQRH